MKNKFIDFCKKIKCPKIRTREGKVIAGLIIGTAFAMILILVASFIGQNKFYSQAQGTPLFAQNVWVGPADPTASATLPGNASGWTKLDSSSNINFSNPSLLTLAQSVNKWQESGVAVSTDATDQYTPQITSDGFGGAIIIWQDGRGDSIYVQRIDSSGAPLWTTDGVALSPGNQFNPQIISDGMGGAIIVWEDDRNWNYSSDIYAQRIDASGALQWTADGVAVSAVSGSDQTYPRIVSDGSHGAIITWQDNRNGDSDIYAQRINSSGAPQWTADGVAVSAVSGSDQNFPSIISDGSNGAVITWYDFRIGNGNVYAQRINDSCAPNPGDDVRCWDAGSGNFDGIAISSVPPMQDNPQITSDGSGGAIITWGDYRNGMGNADIYAQRINSLGVAQWTANGVAISTAIGHQYNYQITHDGLHGAIITWMDSRNGSDSDIYAQRIDSSGISSWTNNGAAISTATGDQSFPQITSDGSGGAIITWEDYRNGDSDVYAQKINSSGAVQWPANGAAISAATNNQGAPQITSDGSGGAIITWDDNRNGSDYDIYAQKVGSLAFANSGDLVSSIIDTGAQTSWESISWVATTPVGASVSLQTRTAADDYITNQALGKTFLASSEYSPSKPASNVGDGDLGSQWQSEDNGSPISTSNPQWIAVDFGIPTKVSRVDLWYDPKVYPIDFDVQVCKNNISCDESVNGDWNTVKEVVGNQIANHLTTSFDQAITEKIRILITNIDSPSFDMVVIDELEAYSGVFSDWSAPYTISAGSSITSPAGQYIQYKANLSTTDSNVTPELNSVSIFASSAPSSDATPPTTTSAITHNKYYQGGKIYYKSDITLNATDNPGGDGVGEIKFKASFVGSGNNAIKSGSISPAATGPDGNGFYTVTAPTVHFSIDPYETGSNTRVPVNAELQYYAQDLADNTELTKTETISPTTSTSEVTQELVDLAQSICTPDVCVPVIQDFVDHGVSNMELVADTVTPNFRMVLAGQELTPVVSYSINLDGMPDSVSVLGGNFTFPVTLTFIFDTNQISGDPNAIEILHNTNHDDWATYDTFSVANGNINIQVNGSVITVTIQVDSFSNFIVVAPSPIVPGGVMLPSENPEMGGEVTINPQIKAYESEDMAKSLSQDDYHDIVNPYFTFTAPLSGGQSADSYFVLWTSDATRCKTAADTACNFIANSITKYIRPQIPDPNKEITYYLRVRAHYPDNTWSDGVTSYIYKYAPEELNQDLYSYLALSYPVNLPKDTTSAVITIKNNGSAIWYRSSFHLGTIYPRDHVSQFAASSWLTPNRIQMKEDKVMPGGIATFEFNLSANSNLADDWFAPVVENYFWLLGGVARVNFGM